MALKTRLARLETSFASSAPTTVSAPSATTPVKTPYSHSNSSQTTPVTFFPPQRHDDQFRISANEKAFTALEGLAEVMEIERDARDKNKQSSSSTGPQQEIWPDIVLTTDVPRTEKWHRDLLQSIECLPEKAQMEYMVDFYFEELQVIRMSARKNLFLTF